MNVIYTQFDHIQARQQRSADALPSSSSSSSSAAATEMMMDWEEGEETGGAAAGAYPCETQLNLPHAINLSGCRGIQLLDVHGYVHPRFDSHEEQHYYLCCDFVADSMLQLNNGSVRLFPILRRITISKKMRTSIPDYQNGIDVPVSRICEQYPQPLFIPLSRTDIESFRMYLIDGNGKIPSFTHFSLKCSLLPTA